MGLTPGGSPFPWAPEGPAGRTRGRGRGGQLPAAPGPISVESISCPQSALPTPLRDCQATGQGDSGGVSGSARGGELYTEPVESRWPCPAGHLLSSRVRCSALSVRTFTFSEVLRGRRGVIRLTAAVLRKRLARPRVGELSQPGRGRGSAPPMARACVGRCGGERRPDATQPPTTPQDSGPLGAPVIHGAAEREGKLCASTHGKGTCPVGSSLPARRGRWPWVTPLPA